MTKEGRQSARTSSSEKAKVTSKKGGRREPLLPRIRPSKKRRSTEGQVKPCPVCDSIEWETDEVRGEVLCAICGLVVEERVIDTGAEWTNHGDSEDKSRVGAPITPSLSDKGLNTRIDRSDLRGVRAARHGIRGSGIRDWNRRAVMDERSKTRSSRARNLTQAMQFIRDKGDLPPRMVDEAATLYRKAVEKGVVAGRSIRGVAAACTYLAAREAGIPRRLEDVRRGFQVDDKELKRTIRLVSRTLGTHRITGPDEYFDVFTSKLELPPQVLGETNYLWDRVKEFEEWQGKKPAGIAGVIIYKAAQMRGNHRTQAEVCKVAGISEVTLRGLLRLLDRMLDSLGEGQVN